MSNFINEIKEAWQIALFKHPAMHKVAEDKSKTIFGYYIIIAGAILSFLGQQIFSAWFRPSLTYGILMAVMQVVMAVIGIYVISFIAKKLFKGQAMHDQFFRVTAYGMVIMWVSIVPQLSIVGGIWGLILLYMILVNVHKLTSGGAIGTILVAIVVSMVISALLTPLYLRFGSYGIMGGVKINDATKTIDLSGSKVDMGEAGKVEFGTETMKITNEKGEVVEIKIPKITNE